MSTKPRVLNRRTMQPEDIPNSVYVGRPSRWGNPYSHTYAPNAPKHVDSREEAIHKFKMLMERSPKLRSLARQELRGKNLVCYCAPLPCHADVLLEIANGDD